jgi:hypothetical protein
LTWLVPWEAAKLSSCWHGRTLGETRNQLKAQLQHITDEMRAYYADGKRLGVAS